MKKILLLIFLALLPARAFAADLENEIRPHWSFEFKAGIFVPDIENWAKNYGDRSTGEYGAALSYKITRQLEAGVEGAFMRAAGTGTGLIHQTPAGYVTLNLYPLDVFVVARGIFNENQWLVPYAGGGWSRVFYREEVQFQGVARGSVDGYHARAGIQFLLDVLDPSAANSFYLDYGVRHTYLFIEGKYSRVMADTVDENGLPSGSVNIGGKSLLGGLLFEF